jgi:hypothetical protein
MVWASAAVMLSYSPRRPGMVDAPSFVWDAGGDRE